LAEIAKLRPIYAAWLKVGNTILEIVILIPPNFEINITICFKYYNEVFLVLLTELHTCYVLILFDSAENVMQLAI